jgi:hypothetical protein
MAVFSKNSNGLHGSTFFGGNWSDIERSACLVGVGSRKGEIR